MGVRGSSGAFCVWTKSDIRMVVVKVADGGHSATVAWSAEMTGPWPMRLGSRCVRGSYSNILSTKTHLRPAMQRHRLTRQAKMGTMQIFSEFKQVRTRSTSIQMQQVAMRPLSPSAPFPSTWLAVELPSAVPDGVGQGGVEDSGELEPNSSAMSLLH